MKLIYACIALKGRQGRTFFLIEKIENEKIVVKLWLSTARKFTMVQQEFIIITHFQVIVETLPIRAKMLAIIVAKIGYRASLKSVFRLAYCKVQIIVHTVNIELVRITPTWFVRTLFGGIIQDNKRKAINYFFL